MTRKEVQAVIDANPGKQLYLTYGNSFMQMHEAASKTRILKASKCIHTVRVTTYGEERADLASYLNRPNSQAFQARWVEQIVTFDATEKAS